MEIKLESRLEAFLKKTLGVEDIQPVVQKVISDWVANVLVNEFHKVTTGQDMLDVIEKKEEEKIALEAVTIVK